MTYFVIGGVCALIYIIVVLAWWRGRWTIDEGDASLFLMGFVLFAIVWPLTLAMTVIFGLAKAITHVANTIAAWRRS